MFQNSGCRFFHGPAILIITAFPFQETKPLQKSSKMNDREPREPHGRSVFPQDPDDPSEYPQIFSRDRIKGRVFRHEKNFVFVHF